MGVKWEFENCPDYRSPDYRVKTVQAGLQIVRTVHFLIESSDSKIYKVKTMATVIITFGG